MSQPPQHSQHPKDGTPSPAALPDSSFLYELKILYEQVGLGRQAINLKIECIKDLNRTIDLLFEHLQESGNAALLEELCPYFGVIWPSARALALYLTELGTENLKGKSLLEVGCGLAIPSLAAGKLGARVTATDFHPEVPRFLEKNIELNQISHLHFVQLDWRKETLPPAKYDWVIGSDILYERQHPAWVAPVIARYLSDDGTAVITDPGRPYLQTFADEMKRFGFHNETLVRTVPCETAADGKKDIFVLILKRIQEA
ncbi:MAG: methyltransferase domain-containing protein [Methylotenera sp.]|nr:methyltransferase domain-containing protein [Oligoflexia bacterium]